MAHINDATIKVMNVLRVGGAAPDVTLQTTAGISHPLSSFWTKSDYCWLIFLRHLA